MQIYIFKDPVYDNIRKSDLQTNYKGSSHLPVENIASQKCAK